MTHEDETGDELFDFLYHDSNRISSYYAQLFSGRLSSVQHADIASSARRREGKLDAKLVSGENEVTRTTTSSKIETLDPHDTIVADVVDSLLHRSGDRNLNPVDAKNGSLILAHGTIVFVDKAMGELAKASLQMTYDTERNKSKAARNQTWLDEITPLIRMFPIIDFASAFILKSDNGYMVAGTLEDDGMEESISSYHFKHGAEGLSDVLILGIKEKASGGLNLPQEGVTTVSAQAGAQILSQLAFPKEAIKVTPIAIYRKLK